MVTLRNEVERQQAEIYSQTEIINRLMVVFREIGEADPTIRQLYSNALDVPDSKVMFQNLQQENQRLREENNRIHLREQERVKAYVEKEPLLFVLESFVREKFRYEEFIRWGESKLS